MNTINAVLFDLDGTLLPMDQGAFVKTYFGGISAYLAPHGYDPKELINTIWAGTAAMVKNDGSCTNETAFWQAFCKVYGDSAIADIPHFDAFYHEKFDLVQSVCGFAPQAAEIVHTLAAAGYMVILATNPIFPRIATEKRLAWAGLSPADFAWVTTYENAHYSKPNPAYYTEILERFSLSPTECLMVGNDVAEDMLPTQSLGMQTFLVTDCIIPADGVDCAQFPQGHLADLCTACKLI